MTDTWLALVLMILHELSLGDRSQYHGYLSSLPSRIDVPMVWTSHQMSFLNGCSFLPRARFFDLRHDFESIVVPLVRAHPALFPPKTCTFETFARANSWILSRAFRPRVGESRAPCLLPLIDLCNTTSLRLEPDERGHEQRINADVKWVEADGGPTLQVHTLPGSRLKAGQQIYIPYGSIGLSNASLLTRYGFVEGVYPHTENESDELSLDTRMIVDLIHGVGGGVATSDAQSEEEEARAVHQKHTKASTATGDVSAAKTNGNDDKDDDDDVSDDDSAAGDTRAHAGHVAFIEGLPFEYFRVPATGELPLRFIQFIAVLLGSMSPDVFGNLCERDAYEARRQTLEEDRKAKAASDDAKATASSATEFASPSPPPLGGLYMSGAGDVSQDEEPAFSSEMVRTIDARTATQFESSPDVFTHAFLVLHHVLGMFDTTLEEDASHLAQLESTVDDESSVDTTRLLLALRVRTAEKRIIYRAIERVKLSLDEVEGEFDDDGSDDDDAPMALVQQALLAAGEAEDGDGDDHDRHADPNIVDPNLIAMLTNQRRPLKRKDGDDAPSAAVATAPHEDDDDDEVEDAASVPTRFTYTARSATASSHAKKKRKG